MTSHTPRCYRPFPMLYHKVHAPSVRPLHHRPLHPAPALDHNDTASSTTLPTSRGRPQWLHTSNTPCSAPTCLVAQLSVFSTALSRQQLRQTTTTTSACLSRTATKITFTPTCDARYHGAQQSVARYLGHLRRRLAPTLLLPRQQDFPRPSTTFRGGWRGTGRRQTRLGNSTRTTHLSGRATTLAGPSWPSPFYRSVTPFDTHLRGARPPLPSSPFVEPSCRLRKLRVFLACENCAAKQEVYLAKKNRVRTHESDLIQDQSSTICAHFLCFRGRNLRHVCSQGSGCTPCCQIGDLTVDRPSEQIYIFIKEAKRE
jgi:hypothetical protein